MFQSKTKPIAGKLWWRKMLGVELAVTTFPSINLRALLSVSAVTLRLCVQEILFVKLHQKVNS